MRDLVAGLLIEIITQFQAIERQDVVLRTEILVEHARGDIQLLAEFSDRQITVFP